VIIDNLDFNGVSIPEPEADAPLIVNTDAPLSLPLALESLKPVAWRHPQVLNAAGDIQYREFSHGRGLDTVKPLDALAAEHGFGIAALERFNHD
jgi:hypothetical protein